MASNRFELEIITTFQSPQGLDATVARIKSELAQLTAPTVSVGGTGGALNPGAAAAQIKQLNDVRIQAERAIQQLQAAGQITSGPGSQAAELRRQITAQYTDLSKDPNFIRLQQQAKEVANPPQLFTSTRQVQAAVKQQEPTVRPTAGATETAEPATTAQLAKAQEARVKQAAEVTREALAETDLARYTAELASARKDLQAQVASQLTADSDYTKATVELATARSRLKISELEQSGPGTAAFDAKTQKDVAQRTLNAQSRIAANAEADIALQADLRVSNEELAAATKKLANERAIAANGGSQIGGEGDLYQRLKARSLATPGSGVIDSGRQQTFGQQFTSVGIRSLDYAISGTALYAGAQALRSMLTETVELDKQFSLLKQQFDSLGEGSQFPAFRAGILEISQSTGVAANEVANVAYQLKGAFGDSTVAINNTRSAMELVAASGLTTEQVTNSLTAAATAYGVSFEQIGDKVEGLRQRYGVLESQSVVAFGTSAAAAKAAGLTFEQLGEIIGAVGRASGQGADVIGSSIARILPNLTTNSSKIEGIYSQLQKAGDVSKAQLDAVTQDFANNQTGEALKQILKDQQNNAALRAQLLPAVAGTSRDLPTASALFQSSRQILNPQDDTGALQARFDSLQKSLTLKLSELEEKFRQIGVSLSSSGLLGALKLLAVGLIGVVDILGTALKLFTDLDSALGHIPSDILSVVVAMKLLEAAVGGISKFGNIVGDITGSASARVARQAATQAAAGSAGNVAGNVAGAEAGAAVERESASFTSQLGAGLEAGATTIVGGVRSVSATIVAQLTQVGEFIIAQTRLSEEQVAIANARLAAGARAANAAVIAANARLDPGAAAVRGAGGAAAEGGAAASPLLASAFGIFAAALAVGAGVLVDKAYRSLQENVANKQVQERRAEYSVTNETATQLNQEFQAGKYGQLVVGKNSTEPTYGTPESVGAYKQLGANRIRDLQLAEQLGLVAQDKATNDLVKKLQKAKGEGPAGAQAQKLLDDLQKHNAVGYKQLQDAITGNTQSALAAISTPEQQYAAGQIDFNAAVQQAQSDLDQAAAAAKSGKPADEQAYQKALDTYNSTVTSLFQGLVQGLQGLQAVGVRAPDTSGVIAQMQAFINNPNGNKAAQAQVAGQLVAFQQQNLQTQIANAKTPEEALQIARTPITLTDADRQALANLWKVPLDQIPTQITDTVQDIYQQLQSSLQLQLSQEQVAFNAGQFNPNAPFSSSGVQFLNPVVGNNNGTNSPYGNLGQTGAPLPAAPAGPTLNPYSSLDQAKFAVSQAQQALDSANLANSGASASATAAQDVQTKTAALQQAQQNLLTQNDNIATAQQQLQAAIDSKSPLRSAQDAISAANLMAQQARGDPAKTAQAAAALAAAQQNLASVNQSTLESQIQLQAARDAQNPQLAAQDQIRLGNYQAAVARANGDPAGVNSALAQVAAGQIAQRQANEAVANAKIDLLKAQNPLDALRQAQLDQQKADIAAQYAVGAAAQLEAAAQRVQADKSVQDALEAIAQSRYDVLVAQANQTGDVVKAAELSVQKAQQALQNARSRGAGTAELNALQVQVTQAQSQATETSIQTQEQLIQFNLNMQKITLAQAVAAYQGLLKQATTPQDQMQIEQQIHDWQQAAGQDLQYNLPTDLGLPTLYTARRLLSSPIGTSAPLAPGLGGSSQVSNDNRIINITLNEATDGQQAVQTIVNALSAPPTTGNYARLY